MGRKAVAGEQEATVKQGRGPDGRFRGGGKPHNAMPVRRVESLEQLVKSIAAEPREVTAHGRKKSMSRAERLIRLRVQAAAKGDETALRQIIRLMLKFPKVVGEKRRIIIRINGVAMDL